MLATVTSNVRCAGGTPATASGSSASRSAAGGAGAGQARWGWRKERREQLRPCPPSHSRAPAHWSAAVWAPPPSSRARTPPTPCHHHRQGCHPRTRAVVGRQAGRHAVELCVGARGLDGQRLNVGADLPVGMHESSSRLLRLAGGVWGAGAGGWVASAAQRLCRPAAVPPGGGQRGCKGQSEGGQRGRPCLRPAHEAAEPAHAPSRWQGAAPFPLTARPARQPAPRARRPAAAPPPPALPTPLRSPSPPPPPGRPAAAARAASAGTGAWWGGRPCQTPGLRQGVEAGRGVRESIA